MSQISKTDSTNWDYIIKPKEQGSGLNFSELFRYKDLLLLFVKRDFISLYKQTILGPLWVLIQPVLTTTTFFIVFTKIASIGTSGVPQILFYLIGVTVWAYFSDCVIKTSDTFILNQNIFGKVYFPRLIVPFSIVITNLIKFAIQFVLFLVVFNFYFFVFGNETTVLGDEGRLVSAEWGVSWHLVLIPLLIFIMACLGLGIGLIISALTTKYRDLRFLIQFGIQLVMYATPVVWPLNGIPEQHRWKLILNPMTEIVETFKAAFFGAEFAVFEWHYLAYSFVFSFIVLFVGMRLFSKVERSFMDTI